MSETARLAAPHGTPQSARTIARLWREAAASPRTSPAYLVETPSGWREVSWTEADRRIREYANGLLSLGVEKGERFAILARNDLDWALLDFALAQIGAVSVPVYASSSARDAAYVIGHAECVGVACEDEEQRAKIEAIASELPGLEHVFTFAGIDDLAASGREWEREHPTALDEASSRIGEEDLYTIIYTSGTTGPPKGCMLAHRNYYAMVSVVDQMDSYYRDDDVMLLYLPLAHNFGRLMLLTGAYVGFPLALLADPLRVVDAASEVRPTILPSVPRVFEKVHAAVLSRFAAATGVRRRLVDWALPVGLEASRLEADGRAPSATLRAKRAVADRLVFSKVRERFGGRLRLAISGGAPLSKEIAEFFDAVGIRIVEGYGLTECTTACATNIPDRYRFGTVGHPLPGFEIRIAADGEIEVRSETVFKGYFKDPAATAQVLTSDGWLKTGDVGEIDADGFLRITDRKKDILVTAGGKNVAPQNIEGELKASRYISQAIVVGDNRPFVAALVTLDADEIRRWAAERGIQGGVDVLSADPRVQALVQEAVDDVNRDRSRFEQVKRFAILPRDFTADAGEVTPTLKLRRRAVAENFAREIEELYAAPSADGVRDETVVPG